MSLAFGQLAKPGPLLSVVVPCYNCSATVQATLGSVFRVLLSVDSGAVQVVLVNDGSEDGSERLLSAWCDQVRQLSASFDVILINQENAGLGEARNAGIRDSTGVWVTFLDADDKWLHAGITDLVNRILPSAVADVVKAPFLTDSKPTRSPSLIRTRDARSLFDGIPGVWRLVIRREFLARNAIQFPPLRFVEDLPFIAALIAKNPQIQQIDAPIYDHASTVENSLTSGRDERWLVVPSRLRAVRSQCPGSEYDWMFASLAGRHLASAFRQIPAWSRIQYWCAVRTEVLIRERISRRILISIIFFASLLRHAMLRGQKSKMMRARFQDG